MSAVILSGGAGLLVTALLGLSVSPFLGHIRDRIYIPPISEDASVQHRWHQLVTHPKTSGQWVGWLERLVMYGAMYLEPKDAAAAIGVWLAFKLAAKWEAWSNIALVPDSLSDVGVDPLRYAIARRMWAAQGYATLVLGTGANFLIALFGTAVRVMLPWLLCLGA
jgi:hypothetical protein